MAQSWRSTPSGQHALNFHQEPEVVGSGPQSQARGGGLSLYRALARHIIGDPTYYKSILHAILTHYWRVLVDKSNPYHLEYKRFEEIEFGSSTKFFNALSCPDSWLSFGWQNGSSSILRVVTNALDIKLVLWKEGGIFWEDGPVKLPEYQVEFGHNNGDKRTLCWRALTPANDGKILIKFLEGERSRLENEPNENALRIRRLVWWREPVKAPIEDPVEDDASSDSDSGSEAGSGSWSGVVRNKPITKPVEREYQCYNEYASDGQGPPDLVDNLYSFHVFTVVIRYPSQIRPALRLLDEALKRAPGQEVSVSQGSGQSRPLKRYVALDAEFKKVYLEKEALAEIEMLSSSRDREQMIASNPEELCSILTVAVDRHLVFSFYLLDMLQNPTDITVEEVSYLFGKLIFNQEYLKLWFNFQGDMSVLDATIAHMYQGTPRDKFKKTDWKTEKEHWIHPTWKIHSGRYESCRPQHLVFPRFRAKVDSCDLHNNKPDHPQTRLNAQGLSCPCKSTGNVDITTVVEFLCRQLGFRDPMWGKPCGKRVWHEVKHGCNYGAFLVSTMQTDRLHGFFQYLKNAPSRAYPDVSRDDWYQSLGPGMETDSDKMGYNIGDVAGVALLMRFLTTTDDRMLFVTALYNYMGCGEFEFVPVKHYPQIKSELIPPQPDSPNAYIYLNDYPKSWKRRMIGNDPYPAVGQYIPLKVGDIFKGRVDEHRRLLSYFEHDKRAQAARESFQRAKKLYGAAGPTFPRVTAVALEVARARIFDPLNYSFPRWFTHKAADPIRAVNGRLPLIRAGVTPYEDLLTLIQDIKKHDPDAQIRLPTTRYERKSDWFGLPRHIEQKAGTKSFKLPDTRVPLSPIEPSDLDPIEPQAESTLSRAARKRREDVRVLNHDWKLQRELDTDAGKAAQTRFDDIFDPRGRNYRRDWQRTNDGEVWESPSPPGTAPDKEPSPHEVPFSPAASEGPSQSIALDEEPWNRQSLEGYPGGPLNTDWEGDSGEPSNTFDWENSIVPDEAPMNADEKLWNSDEEPTNPDGELRNSDEEPMYSDEETIYSDEDEVPGIKPSKRRYTLETDPRPPTRRYTLEINLTPSTRRQTLEVKPRLSKRRFTETDQRPVKRVRSWNHRV